MTREITGRKEAGQALKESEERYRRLVENAPETIVVIREEKVVFINAAGVKLAGADCPEDLVGKPYSDFVHPDFREIASSRISRAREGETADLLQEKLPRLDGSTVDVEFI